mgnify:CR=1 FL=1
MLKRLSFLFALFTLAIVLVACGDSNTEDANDNADDTATEENGDGDTLVIGIDDQFAPMGFRDENNEIVGFDIDYARAAAEHMGVEVKFQPIDWKTKETELTSGRIDLIWNGYTITDERKEKVNFTKPYLENAQVIAVLVDSDIETLADLEGKNIGLQALSSAVDAFEDSDIADNVGTVTEYADNVLVLTDLQAGRIDAAVIDEVAINYYMTEQENTFKILDETLAPEQYGVGVRKEDDELLNKLQAALDEMNENGTAAEISEKWFGEDKVLK